MKGRCELYRHFDAEGRLLYVGITSSTFRRMRQHKHNSSWYEQVTRIEIERFPSREAARQAEMVAIDKEKPLFNMWTEEKKGPKARPDAIQVDRQKLIDEAERKNIKIHKGWCLKVLKIALREAPKGVPYPYQ